MKSLPVFRIHAPKVDFFGIKLFPILSSKKELENGLTKTPIAFWVAFPTFKMLITPFGVANWDQR